MRRVRSVIGLFLLAVFIMQGAERDRLLAQVYDELRIAAARLVRREAAIVTMQPTELVNEAAIRVIGLERMAFADRQHMFATCSRILRQTMLDEIRKKRAAKRQAPEVTLLLADMQRDVDADVLADLIERLEAINPDYAHIVDLRFFVGLTLEEIAATLGINEKTARRRWQAARAWLAAEMEASDD
jgi:RNA polymerase sigma factor (TIGR02999 family)